MGAWGSQQRLMFELKKKVGKTNQARETASWMGQVYSEKSGEKFLMARTEAAVRLARSQITSGLLRLKHLVYILKEVLMPSFFNWVSLVHLGFTRLDLASFTWDMGLLSCAAELLTVSNRSADHVASMCANRLRLLYLVTSTQQSHHPCPARRPPVTPRFGECLVHLCVHIVENTFWIEPLFFNHQI